EPQRREGDVVVQPLVSTSSAVPVTLTYRFQIDSFVARLEGSIGGPAVAGRRLLVTLPSRIRSEEADVRDDARHLAFAYKRSGTEVHSIKFDDLDSLVTRVDTGAIHWMTQRNKYFVLAAIPRAPDTTFRALLTRGGPRTGPEATSASATALLPLRDGNFALRVFAGPQAWDHLRVTAPQLENVNPYGGWLHDLVQPFATIVMRILLWMKATTQLNYGWVLVIFGVAVRLLMWPLNQSAMRSSMKMQELQPELQEVQRRFASNPEKQREEIMKVYQAHGMSPFSTVSGCLPMLLPMPVLFALFFVFQNTIEFRGVPFLWLPDLSMKDPFYIIVVLMGLTTFLVSWVGMRGMPPNPQAKVVSYVMPLALTVFLVNMASGLNLYYTVQNLAALPQQWLIARERMRAAKAREARSPTPSRPAEPPATKTSRKRA
ncbi:MAG TPA: YidC/Oxa1 family insertase periplasmic-domain containing protein, partial [Gemmatimonadaceae bacterium]|nr:YidC/Oxa1 family insertase periplasmic-domain containing protein [Gemmatimonadaceae bacterium]